MTAADAGSTATDRPRLPAYGNGCITDVVPALLAPGGAPTPRWLPAGVAASRQRVLLVLDGLGWLQLGERRHLAPTLDALAGGPIDSVAPTTTSTALTSIATGTTPGEHGVIGYRIDVHGQVLNVLRWSTSAGDARRSIPPGDICTIPPFLGTRPTVVTKAEFSTSGFSMAHLAGSRHHGWRTTATLVTEVRRSLAAGETFVYAYYDGIDKVAHEYGFGEYYDAELAFCDRLVAEILALLPPGASLTVTADHGQVQVGDNIRRLSRGVLDLVHHQSGEGRFRWLHAKRGRAAELLAAASAEHGHEAWVVSRDRMRDEGWFGPVLSADARDRLGDVALVTKDAISFDDPDDTGPYRLVCRHGALTDAELLVPLLAGWA